MTKLTPQQTDQTVLQRIESANNLFDILALRGTVADYMEAIADLMYIGVIEVDHADKITRDVETKFRRKMCQLNTITHN